MENLQSILSRDLPEITGRNVHLSVDLGFLVRHKVLSPSRLNSFTEELLDAVIDLAGPARSVMVSTFNFDFGRTQLFDVLLSEPQVGRFSQLSMKHPLGIRTLAPLYSFKVFGAHTAQLEPYPFERCFGEESPFDFQVNHSYLLLTIGHHINKALTLVHHSENVAGVPWREETVLRGRVRTVDRQWRSARVNFFARKPGVAFSGLTIEGDKHFRDIGLIQRREVSSRGKRLPVEFGDLKRMHCDFVSSLSQNETRLAAPIYDGKPNPLVITGGVADRLFSRSLNEE